MKRLLFAGVVLLTLLVSRPVLADGADDTVAGGETTASGVRVTIEKRGNEYRVVEAPASHSGAGTPAKPERDRTVRKFTRPADPASGTPARDYVMSSCGEFDIRTYWLDEADLVDLDAAAAAEAGRYVDNVLKPQVRIGANPATQGLVGLSSWFWIEGWAGAAQAPPISAYGVTIDVRMTSGSVEWDFGDGTTVSGDLGQAYPARSSVRHAYQRPGSHTVTATIALAAEYRIDGGPWLTLDPLTASATTQHPVQERQAVIVER